MRSTVDEFGWSRRHSVDGLLGEKDGVTGGLGELFDAGGDVDGVTDQGELQLASPADGACDHLARVDPDADPKLLAESLGDEAVNQRSGAHRGIGMTGKIVRGTEDCQSAVAEELVDMPTRVHNSRHHDLEQRVQ